MSARATPLAGAIFSRLTVISAAENGKLKCRCECGTVKEIKRYHVTSGATRSCGCLSVDVQAARNEAYRESVTGKDRQDCIECRKDLPLGAFRKQPGRVIGVTPRCRECMVRSERAARELIPKKPKKFPRKDLRVGQRFGRLTVMDRPPEKRDNCSAYHWWCKCDCGEERLVVVTHLTRATQPTRSCGCLATESSRRRLTTWDGAPQKQCSRCKSVKPLDHFRPDQTMASGRNSRCLTCAAEIHSLWTRQQVVDLSDRYVALTMRLPVSAISSELIQRKREQLILRRLARQLKQASTKEQTK